EQVEVAWCHRREPLSELDGLRVRVGPQREVGKLASLPCAGLGYLSAAVPDLTHEQAGQAVQVTLAVLVVDVLTLASDDHLDVAVRVGRHPGEMQPQVPLGLFLE